MMDARSLMQRIQALPPERIAEIEDFVAFIAARQPFTSSTAFKQRPAVVVSNAAYNGSRPEEVWIEKWREAGLIKPSAIKPVFAILKQRW